MILTLNDKRLNELKHHKGILVKNVNTGKFDVMEIGTYPSHIIEIAIVKITEPGLSRTMSLYNIRQMVKNLNCEQIKEICKAGGYTIINQPESNKPLIKKEIVTQPKEYRQGPLREEEISEGKFMGYRPKVITRHTSFIRQNDKKISLNKASELQNAIREFNFITNRNVILSVSAANKKFAIVENGTEVYSTNKANKLLSKIFALLTIWKVKNQDIAAKKIAERKENIQKLVANGFGE